MKDIPTPELDKMLAVKGESQAIGQFLDWLEQNNRCVCGWDSDCQEHVPLYMSIEKLLAEYFEIDLNKIENERRAILESIRP